MFRRIIVRFGNHKSIRFFIAYVDKKLTNERAIHIRTFCSIGSSVASCDLLEIKTKSLIATVVIFYRNRYAFMDMYFFTT